QAAPAEESDAFVFRGLRVWIVAGDAAELPTAGGEATAQLHLLDVVDRVWIVQVGVDENVPELAQWHSGAAVEQRAPAAQHAGRALEVALLAAGVAQPRLQLRRVDDRVRLPAHRDVQLAGPMAALAADRGLGAEKRLLVLVHLAGDGLDAVGMAEEAAR